ncbi:MAG: zf-HC2 domain-containing protein [Deltaproteobacteria bacterium]|nr:zf-HC2 domain-containing protein [Deltaproteobacteria bacterium]
MLTCREITELVTDYLEGNLGLADRLRFQLHLGMCRHCRAYLRQLRATIAAMKKLSQPAPDEAMPTDVQAELLKRFRNWKS